MNWKLLLISSLLLAGCSWIKPTVLPPRPVVVTEYVRADCGTPPQRAPVEFRHVEWLILEVSGEQRFTLTAGEYENLAFNTSEIIKGAKELRAEIQYYLDCLSRPPDGGQ